ncbi:MAG: bifunctional glutamate N-acetyltransferase/amino-acid acetyltransferase ArgJ [Alphaproteobacteria bacterium]|nr:bifunctional glutamate N-acetyltransferase/amino-acid acetyltransferase ArgJ [Alphaproteobacteria bacterium]
MAEIPVSPFAPARFPALPAVAGVAAATAAAGVRYKGREDVLLTTLPRGSTVAGTFTRNTMPGAPVDWSRRHVAQGKARALVVNTGNANVFTGKAGAKAVRDTAEAAAKLLGCRPAEVFVASTGVIGEPLPAERILAVLGDLARAQAPADWQRVANAIRTTDTFAKGAGRIARIGQREVAIAGVAKGSGMIQPDMATMLAFVFTDARLPADVLRGLLRPAVDDSFNAITVDSDTSTSDTVLLFATGQVPLPRAIARAGDPLLRDFRAKLLEVCQELAQQIVRDGEGAQKFVEIRVGGAASKAAARRIGLAVANSPLVKTAIAGADANWGRVVMAVGKSGEKADRDRLSIRMGGVTIAERGYPHPDYREEQVRPHMRGREILIEVDVGIGTGSATVWTCDLTHGYISINGDYRS